MKGQTVLTENRKTQKEDKNFNYSRSLYTLSSRHNSVLLFRHNYRKLHTTEPTTSDDAEVLNFSALYNKKLKFMLQFQTLFLLTQSNQQNTAPIHSMSKLAESILSIEKVFCSFVVETYPWLQTEIQFSVAMTTWKLHRLTMLFGYSQSVSVVMF